MRVPVVGRKKYSNPFSQASNSPIHTTRDKPSSKETETPPILILDPAILRPECLAQDRLVKWRPVQSPKIQLIRNDGRSITDILSEGLAENTRKSYAPGLRCYHQFCDAKDVAEIARAPASHTLIVEFVGSIIGFFAPSTIKGYYYSVDAWHRLHILPFPNAERELNLLLKAANVFAPPSSKKPKRAPITVQNIEAIHSLLNHSDPFDAAFYACLVTCFWSVSRLGEFTVERKDVTFDPKKHISINNLRDETDRNGNEVQILHLPSTKTERVNGEDVQWAQQSGVTDPVSALKHHLRINKPSSKEHLFSYTDKGLRVILSKKKFTDTLSKLTKKLNIFQVYGHSLRIGGTLEYLLRNVPFLVVKTMGCWKGDSFQIYLRRHGQVLASYIQDKPIFQQLLKELPPVRTSGE
ncbi:hypothetical protein BDN72DRAFT_781868 [Pluteus cervinus]|uniref:Uncharacterized protein n=1 Tax=Pluteus cervinus TaxID=181527 RepID=A0ACD2ZYE8_9AGAR|nr:hypothetical protein BDN72DRAFT_781868 [Pluteus cervinus]